MIDLFKLFFIKGNKRCGLRVTAGDVMKIFSMSDPTENILTIQLNYDELYRLDTHGKIISATLTLVDTVTLDYSLGDILIKSMEISKNIMFSGKPSTANKKEMTPFSLLFFIDSEAHRSTLELDFSNDDIGDIHIKRLEPLFPYLEKLDLRGKSGMTSRAMKYISDVLMQSIEENKKCNLKVINIGSCNILDHHIQLLQPLFPYIEKLDLRGNSNMTSRAMKYVSDVLMQSNEENKKCNLKEINIGYCDLTDEHIEYLQPCIPYLEKLTISGNKFLSSQGMKYISDAIIERIQVNKTCNMKEIDASHCDLHDLAIDLMAPCLPYLKQFLINGNNLSYHSKELISNKLGIAL